MERTAVEKDWYISLESRPEDFRIYESLDDEGKEVFLTSIFNDYDSNFFEIKKELPLPDGYLVRRGDLVLRGTRLCPEDVCDIVDSGELVDYNYLTNEKVDACLHYCYLYNRNVNDLVRYGTKEFYFRIPENEFF